MNASSPRSDFLSILAYFLIRPTNVITECAQACYFIAVTNCLTDFKKYARNFTDAPPFSVISRRVLDISGTQQPPGRDFHSDVLCDALPNTVFFFNQHIECYNFTVLFIDFLAFVW